MPGVSRDHVRQKLGQPCREWSDEGHDVWVYAVGRTRRVTVTYCVSFVEDQVQASWWSEEVTTES